MRERFQILTALAQMLESKEFEDPDIGELTANVREEGIYPGITVPLDFGRISWPKTGCRKDRFPFKLKLVNPHCYLWRVSNLSNKPVDMIWTFDDNVAK